MFATLLGPLPRPPLPADAAPVELLRAVIQAQEAAGLEPLSDCGFGIGDSPIERWQMAAAMTDRTVKQVMVGPFTDGRGEDVSLVETRHAELLALAAAGCPYIEVHEPAATAIGGDTNARARFRLWHQRLLDGVSRPHVSLAITGGNADAAGIDTLLAAPYASLAIDLVAGPDNWRLVVATPGDRGVICGALATERDADDRPEILLWAAGYAASTGGRGSSRVGLASASSMAHLPWDVAVRKLRVLGKAARLADLPPDERRLLLDPRSVDIRSAAVGRVQPRQRPRPRRRTLDNVRHDEE